VCNYCQSTSLPWESGISQDHWETCPRWDNDVSGFICREGICFTDEIECTEHKENQSLMHKNRLAASLKALQIDVGNEKFTQALAIVKNKN
jgi:hypothetical protein